jgi:hypothetical protein
MECRVLALLFSTPTGVVDITKPTMLNFLRDGGAKIDAVAEPGRPNRGDKLNLIILLPVASQRQLIDPQQPRAVCCNH